MKYIVSLLSAGFLTVAGCRGAEERIDPKGAYPDLKTGNVSEGELIVERPAWPMLVHKGTLPTLYSVYDVQGRKVKESSTPETTIRSGRYLVRLEDSQPDLMTFWVTVKPGETTRVDLTRDAKAGPPATVD